VQSVVRESVKRKHRRRCAAVTVICRVRKPVRLLQLLVVTICKCSINPITNPNPIYSHTHDHIKMDLRATGLADVDWIDLAQDRDQWRALVNTVMNLWVA
jgi:hypothetical protein